MICKVLFVRVDSKSEVLSLPSNQLVDASGVGRNNEDGYDNSLQPPFQHNPV